MFKNQLYFENSMKKVKVYTTKVCPECRVVKSYLQALSIDFDEVIVDSPELVKKVEKLSGQRSVPVIQADDKIIVGFDQEKIKTLSSY